MHRRTLILSVLAGTLAGTPAFAHDYKVGALEIAHPWVRATPPTAKAGGGFLVVTNKGTTADRLVSASSGASQQVEIHEMKMDGSVMRMRELADGLEIPAGASVTLKPGGYHIMFMELKAPFTKGNKVPVTLVFEKAGKVDVEFAVQDMGSAEPMKH
jgi:copper(I)-binding protein